MGIVTSLCCNDNKETSNVQSPTTKNNKNKQTNRHNKFESHRPEDLNLKVSPISTSSPTKAST
jgi:hypothetical protein